MGPWEMTKYLGVIAEDSSDVAVIEECVKKVWKGKGWRIRAFAENGGDTIERKCKVWSALLKRQGCRHLIIVRDLDRRDPGDVRRRLQDASTPNPISSRVIVIPVQAIEAWLLADEDALRSVFNIRERLRAIPNPEGLLDPKTELKRLVYNRSGKRREYINTAHNGRIAAAAVLSKLRRCASFRPLEDYLRDAG